MQTNSPNQIAIESICADSLPVIKKRSKWRMVNREIYVSISADNGKPKSTKQYQGGKAMLEERSMHLWVIETLLWGEINVLV